MHGTSSLLNVLFLSLLAIIILMAPIFLYKEIIQHQVLFIDPFIIDNKSMIYGLIAIVWCMRIMTFRHKLIIDELRSQINYLNRSLILGNSRTNITNNFSIQQQDSGVILEPNR
jgi:hypothetical protein